MYIQEEQSMGLCARLDGKGKEKDESSITLRVLTCLGGLMLESHTDTKSWGNYKFHVGIVTLGLCEGYAS